MKVEEPPHKPCPLHQEEGEVQVREQVREQEGGEEEGEGEGEEEGEEGEGEGGEEGGRRGEGLVVVDDVHAMVYCNPSSM